MARGNAFLSAAVLQIVLSAYSLWGQDARPPRADATLADGRKVVLVSDGSWEFRDFAGLSELHLSGARSSADVRTKDLLHGRVIEVINGGTLRVALKGPVFPLAAQETVRLAGTRAPDLATMELFAYESREALLRRTGGDEVFLALDRPLRDDSGRLRAYVYTSEGSCLNTSLVRDGFLKVAAVRTYFAAELAGLQQEAGRARRGLWAGVARKVHIRYVFNAGPREYVEITNGTSSPADLTGWVLTGDRGEVVALPGVVLAPAASVRVYTGREGRQDPPESYYALAREVWDSGGDTVLLFDAGGTLVDLFAYPPRLEEAQR